VALIAALASASFAYQTNRISQRQVELLNRQVAIEESLALPVFTLNVDAGDDSHRLKIHNSGGTAHDLVIDVLPFLSYWWYEPNGDAGDIMMEGDELPLVGYFDEYNYVLPSRMLPGAGITLGFDGNATGLRDVAGRLTDELAAREGVSELDYSLEIVVGLRYIDYMGVERSDTYIGEVDSAGDVFPPHQLMRMETDFGQEVFTDYFEKYGRDFVLVLDPETELPDDHVISALGSRIYDQRFTDVEDAATPVARLREEPTEPALHA
jgi:hypothetical protein